MKWYQAIEDRHSRNWAVYVRHSYVRHLKTWASVHGRKVAIKSQVGHWDSHKDSKGRSICYWLELHRHWTNERYNPLQIVACIFQRWQAANRSEYPRPNQMFEIEGSPESVDERFRELVQVSIKSDAAVLSRIDQHVAVTYGEDCEKKWRSKAVFSSLAENLRDNVIRAAVLDEYGPSQKLTVNTDFLIDPKSYLQLAKDCVRPELLKLKDYKGAKLL